jgi:hypothetical protein
MSRSKELGELIEGINSALAGPWPVSQGEASTLAAKAVLRRVRAVRQERDVNSHHAERLAEAVEGFLFGDLEQVELLMAWLSYQSVLGEGSLGDDLLGG